MVNADLSDIVGRNGPVGISDFRLLRDDIDRTNIAVCGNSTVTIELLRGGRPVLYDHRLDKLTYDYNGYAGHGLVLNYPETLDESFLDQIRQHYLSKNWLVKMRYFDSGYQTDETEMLRRFQGAVLRILQET